MLTAEKNSGSIVLSMFAKKLTVYIINHHLSNKSNLKKSCKLLQRYLDKSLGMIIITIFTCQSAGITDFVVPGEWFSSKVSGQRLQCENITEISEQGHQNNC